AEEEPGGGAPHQPARAGADGAVPGAGAPPAEAGRRGAASLREGAPPAGEGPRNPPGRQPDPGVVAGVADQRRRLPRGAGRLTPATAWELNGRLDAYRLSARQPRHPFDRQGTAQAINARRTAPVTMLTREHEILFCNWLSAREGGRPCYPRD